MKSFSELGFGLSLVFGCLLLAFVAELYYLLWWKKRLINREIEEDYSKYAKEFLRFICWKKPSTLNIDRNQEIVRNPDGISHESDLEIGSSKDLLLKPYGDEEGVDSELMRLHNLAGPPRFLFTIKEETKEDLESDDAKSRGDRSRKVSRTRSLSDLIVAIDTPFLTPLASPRLKSPPWNQLDYYNHHGFNPLFESSDAQLNRLRSSPPPTFKFLRDAEEKLYKRLKEEAEKKLVKKLVSIQDSDDDHQAVVSAEENKDGSFFTFIVPQFPPSSSSQILPLAS